MTLLPFDRPGFVYFAKQRGGHYIKIGFTTNLQARGLGTYLIDVLAHYGPASPDVERELHEHFAHLRVRGEWFRPEAELLAVLGRVVAGEPPLLYCPCCLEHVVKACELPQCYQRFQERGSNVVLDYRYRKAAE